MKPGYYYLHTNGTIIWESFETVDWIGPFAYFNRPFVVRWGMVESQEDYDKLMPLLKKYS
jgi:hypothetical protein